ncbi:MAG: MFS transporter [Alicyclobacillus macrosporangiidus]|uniref:MFS transporter n=1 Tax=Alicyclobacillus macrosporangiidus TaxID=392015 RepID=UPI0026ED53EF|nr:MFS transporter [Alicyclobacillus macrosporangiidus]MCL6598296.1 MFS transporter [Alicyclobacillus macrosporangiidus]
MGLLPGGVRRVFGEVDRAVNGLRVQWNNERLSIANGSFASISMNIVNGFVAMYLLDSLHATDAEMGLLNSLPSLVNLFAMFAAALAMTRVRSKKRFCVAATTVSRTFYVWMALVPWLPLAHPALWVVWLVALTRVPQSFGDLSWQALIGDLIAPDRRSAFFSERYRVLTIVGLVATFATGWALQQFDKHWALPYQVAFLSTVLFSALEIWLLMRHDESKAEGLAEGAAVPVRLFDRAGLTALCRDRRYWLVAGAMLLFNFGWQLSWPLFNIYQISTAHAPAFWLGLFTVFNQLSQVLTYRWWGRMAEKHGNGRMMALAALGMASAPALTIVSTNLYYLCAINVLTGIPLAGTNLLLFNYLLEVSPPERRTTCIAVYNVLLAVVGFAAPEFGIYLLGQAGMTAGMLTSTLLRGVSGLALWWVAVHLAHPKPRPASSVAQGS